MRFKYTQKEAVDLESEMLSNHRWLHPMPWSSGVVNTSFVLTWVTMLGIRLFGQSETTKYFDEDIAYFGSLLELHGYKHSFVSVFDKLLMPF